MELPKFLMSRDKFTSFAAAICLVVSLSACGGGGGTTASSGGQTPITTMPAPPATGQPPTNPPLSFPEAEVQTAPEANAIRVSWVAVSGATGYKVQWQSAASTSWQQKLLNNPGTTSYKITGLSSTQQYRVRVIPIGRNGDGNPSQSSIVTPRVPVPVEITTVNVVAAVNAITVSWAAVSGATGYKVQWQSAASTSWQQKLLNNPGTTSYKITGLSSTQQYRVRVIPIGRNGDGNPSQSSIVTPRVPVPVETTTVIVVATVNSLAVRWDEVENAAHYKVQWKSGSQSWDSSREQIVQGQEYLIVGLTPGTEYSVRVIPVGRDGTEGTVSFAPSTATHPPLSFPEAEVQTNPEANAITVSWVAVSGATGYKVQWQSAESTSWQRFSEILVSNPGTTSYKITGLSSTQRYRVRVIPIGRNGDGSPSQSSIVTPRVPVPVEITTVEVAATVNALAVRWDEVENAVRYKVQWKSGSQSWDSSREQIVQVQEYLIVGLTPGTQYSVRVIPVGRDGTEGTVSSFSSTATPTTPPLVAAPSSVTAIAASNALSVSWTTVSGAVGYKIQWKSGTDAWSSTRQHTVNDPSITSFKINGLTAGTQYTVRIVPIGTYGDGTSSVQRTATPTAPPQPVTAPENLLLADDRQTSLKVSWDAVSGATGYKVQWKKTDQAWSTTTRQADVTGGSTSSYKITGLSHSTVYDVRVIPLTSGPNGPESEVVRGTTVYPPLSTVRTVKSGEELEPATNPRTEASWDIEEYRKRLTQLNFCSGYPNQAICAFIFEKFHSGRDKSEQYRSRLDIVNAAAGYASRTTGQAGGGGISVAVLDDGIEGRHPDLDVAKTRREVGYANLRYGDHGTRVAGVIAARRNGDNTADDGHNMHGIAYNANLIDIPRTVGNLATVATDIASAAGMKRTYTHSNGQTYTSDPEYSAHIMNMSFINTETNTQDLNNLKSAMKDAARQGRIMVAALGNGHSLFASDSNGLIAGPQGAPANLVAEEGIAGYAIAVGAVDIGDNVAGYTSFCGNVKAYCLFAPGSNILTTSRDGAYAVAYGTSFATPMVAGAAATLWAAFSNKNASQIVNRILTTAREVVPRRTAWNHDSNGLSIVYGHGILDLGAAMNPVGWTSLLIGSSLVPVSSSYFDLPPGFGAPQSHVLADAIVYDEQMFPFLHDLSDAFRISASPSSQNAIRNFLSSPGQRSSSLPMGNQLRFDFSHKPEESLRINAKRRNQDDSEVKNYRLTYHALPDLTLTIKGGYAESGFSNEFVARKVSSGPLWDGRSVGPYSSFAGSDTGLGLNWRANKNTRIDFAGKHGKDYFGYGRAWAASLGVTHQVGADAKIGVRYGALRENSTLLGIQGSGAFNGLTGSSTNYLDISMEKQVSKRTALFGSFSQGKTGPGQGLEHTLVDSWKGFRSQAFSFGFETTSVWQSADSLTVTLASPLRISKGLVNIRVPVREISDGRVAYENHKVSVVPTGRERRIQLGYAANVAKNTSLSVGSYIRYQPNNDATASTDFGAGMKLTLQF